MELTGEQLKFLAACEEEFAGRYTELDQSFTDLKSRPLSRPPIVDPWAASDSHQRGNQRNQQRNGRDGRDRQWRDNNRGPRHHEDRNDSSRRHENSYREHRERERHRPQPYEHRGPRSGPS